MLDVIVVDIRNLGKDKRIKIERQKGINGKYECYKEKYLLIGDEDMLKLRYWYQQECDFFYCNFVGLRDLKIFYCNYYICF